MLDERRRDYDVETLARCDQMTGDSWADVKLERWELEAACIVGAIRQARAISDKRCPRFPFRDEAEAWDNHVCAAIGEQGFAKWANVYWNHGVDTFQRFGDVGEIEVRWTAMRPPRLKAKDSDKDATRIVCCSSTGDVVRLHGWMTARTAKAVGASRSPRPGVAAYFVDMDKLLPMHELRTVMLWRDEDF